MLKKLSVKLTNEEKQEKGKLLAEKVVQFAQLCGDNKAIKSNLKASEDALESEIQSIAGIIQDGREVREVEVEEVKDWVDGRVNYVDASGEILSWRTMTQEERHQHELDFKGSVN